jgi:HD-GYP domain-containing protein (c-di-GMP phosphodiesterase class II)
VSVASAPSGEGQGSLLVGGDEIAAAIGSDGRLRPWAVRRRGDGWLELSLTGFPTPARTKGPIYVVVAWPAVWRDPARLAPHLVRAQSGNYGLVVVGADAELTTGEVDHLAGEGDVAALALPTAVPRLALTLRARAEAVLLRQMLGAMELELERAHHENELLISIGRALSQQRDTSSLLEIILRRAREVTGADAGTVYIVENLDADVQDRSLRFRVSQNDSRRVESRGFTLPVSAASIVGTCVLSSDVINVPDLYELDDPGTGNNPWGFVHDRSFDDLYAYQTRSVLTVPMISARNEVIGVIQLINKRARGYLELVGIDDFDDGVVAFDDASVAYAISLASQAGIALENAMLYDEVKTLFEGFVRASVTAIESRDPTTSGHSERVAELTVGLARAVDRADAGAYADRRFSPDELVQMEYAALLHDFGKVGVREHVLVKAKKLYEHQRELILQRFQLIRRGFEVEGLRRKVDILTTASREQVLTQLAVDDRSPIGDAIRELDEFITFILNANEPTVLEQGGFERIADIAARRYLGDDGQPRPYLTDDEASALQILRGSLTERERDEINSHVVHTYNFLRQIPWGRTFRDVPEIAGGHHEKLDGSGYPAGKKGGEILVPTRMMTISDIYDALTARDRPYKKAMPADKALDIIASEVRRGYLDADLFAIFVDAKVWELVQPPVDNPGYVKPRRWSTSPLTEK